MERTLAWMMHAQRHARDYEQLVQHSETLITWAAITLMTRRLTRGKKSSPIYPSPHPRSHGRLERTAVRPSTNGGVSSTPQHGNDA
jgi:hypothetical protein